MVRPGETLSVDVDLDLTVEDSECRVWSEDDRVVVAAPSLSAARSLLSGVDALPLDRGRLAAQVSDAGLAVEIRVRRATVARLGAGVRPSRLGALAGSEAAVSPWGVAVAAWRALG